VRDGAAFGTHHEPLAGCNRERLQPHSRNLMKPTDAPLLAAEILLNRRRLLICILQLPPFLSLSKLRYTETCLTVLELILIDADLEKAIALPFFLAKKPKFNCKCQFFLRQQVLFLLK